MQPIKIVYYVYLNDKSNWQNIVEGQLNQLKSYNMLDAADLHVHITDCFNLERQATSLIYTIAPTAIISVNYENLYEYPGIKLVYDLSKQFPSHNFIYFHTKGMSYGRLSWSPQEIEIFTKTFSNWRKNISYLRKNGITKVGLFPAIWLDNKKKVGDVGGWIFYNFWFASGLYLSMCEEPKANMNRYYYEGWLGRLNGNEPLIRNDCKSLLKLPMTNKNYFTGAEADFLLNIFIENSNSKVNQLIRFLNSNTLAYILFKVKVLKN